MSESEMRVDRRVRQSFRSALRQAFVTGLAVVVPLVITFVVLTVAVNYIYNYLDLFSDYVIRAPVLFTLPVFGDVRRELFVELITPLVLLWTILVVGLVVNSSRYGERAVDYFDRAVAALPGVGSVYESFRQMSDIVLESDTENFREVKLVEFPHEGAYTLGFVTTETPEPLRRPAGHSDMLTLFLPLAPNPVMGGHLVHMPREKVMDVDMTVEEGLRAVVTSGVAVGEGTGASAGLSPEELRGLASVEHADQQVRPDAASPDVRRESAVRTDRPERYDADVDPSAARTPEDIARRERDAGGGDADAPDVTPEERAGRESGDRDSTDRPPEELADRDPDSREPTHEKPAELAGRDREE